jgi:hypothetical protein
MHICAFPMSRPLGFQIVLYPLPGGAIVRARPQSVKIPSEVRPFVEKGMTAIACESGDLDADGRLDYVLVLSKTSGDRPVIDEAGDEDRPTLILIRDADKKLSIAERNDRVSYCKNCGGLFGDPFSGVVVRGTRFTITN